MAEASAQPRIEPGDRRDIGALAWVIAVVSGRVAGTGPPNLFRVLGRHRKLFRGWLRFAGRLMGKESSDDALPPELEGFTL